MAEELNLNKLVSFSDVIVCGYIRPLEKQLSSSLNLNIVPASIIQMCLRYFASHISGQIFARMNQKSNDKFVYIDMARKKVIDVKTVNNGHDINKIKYEIRNL